MKKLIKKLLAKRGYRKLSIAELKTMIEAKEAPETLVEKTEDIELAAEVVEPIAHNPEAVDTQTVTSFENITVQKAKYLNNLVNQFNQ